MARIEIYTSHNHLGECGVNLITKCGVSLYKHGLLYFVTLMHGWACIDYGLQLAAGRLTALHQCMPTHALTFTKHRQPLFNYYNKVVLCRMKYCYTHHFMFMSTKLPLPKMKKNKSNFTLTQSMTS